LRFSPQILPTTLSVYDPILDYSYTIAIAETLGEVSMGSVAMALGIQMDMATPSLANYGSDDLREQFLRPAISGDMVACLGKNSLLLFFNFYIDQYIVAR
jgi:alkylation response protein AidB-like acyl-CoA dehydrogenase